VTNKNIKLNLNNKWLILCGSIAGMFFTFSWIIQGVLRVGYNPMMAPVSSLAIGPVGWIQIATFFITGVLIILFAYGLWKVSISEYKGVSKWGPILLLVSGIGLIGAGCFTTDTTSGYPEAKAIVDDNSSFSGPIHKLFAGLLFMGLLLACFVFTNYFTVKQQQKWKIYSLLSGILFLIGFCLYIFGYLLLDGLQFYSGLFQRITLTIGALWLILISIYFFKN
jgi:hypothetical protein